MTTKCSYISWGILNLAHVKYVADQPQAFWQQASNVPRPSQFWVGSIPKLPHGFPELTIYKHLQLEYKLSILCWLFCFNIRQRKA